LQARGDVDPVPEQVLALHHDVAEIDADAESHLTGSRQLVVPSVQGGLDLRRAAHGLDGAPELGQDRVPGRVENAASVHADEGLEHLLVRPERSQRLLFVLGHQTAVFSDIGREDRREFTFQGLRRRAVGFIGHVDPLPWDCGGSSSARDDEAGWHSRCVVEVIPMVVVPAVIVVPRMGVPWAVRVLRVRWDHGTAG
jgi:hypothetical protein